MTEQEFTIDERAAEIWSKYQKGVAYQAGIGLTKEIPVSVDFFEGRQWGKPVKGTEKLPRITMNLIRLIVNNKRANLLSSPYRIIYVTDSETDRTKQVSDSFNKFAQWWQSEANMAELDAKAVKDGAVKGTYIYYFYWDAKAVGKRGKAEGALRCQMIDPTNIFFADPTDSDEQKQDWMIIAQRETLASVLASLDEGKRKEAKLQLSGDTNLDSPYGQVEQDGTELVTVLIYFWRKDGEVWFTKTTRNMVLQEDTPLTPDYEQAEREIRRERGMKEDAVGSTMDKAEKAKPDKFAARFYPIVVGQYEERENSIYGISEVYPIIPAQRSINKLFSLAQYAYENNAFGKIVAKEGALKNQNITNDPTQILTDHSKVGQGIYNLNTPNLSQLPIDAAQREVELTRIVTGSTEVVNGEVIGKNMSGQAIAQLQSQAMKPIKELRQRFKNAKKKCGRIIEMFFRLYYDEPVEYTYEMAIPGAKPPKQIQKGEFKSTDYEGVVFDVNVEAIQGTEASSGGDVAMLDLAMQNKAIDFPTYLELYPDDAIGDKSKMLEKIREMQENKYVQQERMLAEYQEKIAQLTELVAKQDETVKDAVRAIKSNENLQAKFIQLWNEADMKLGAAQQQIGAMQQNQAVMAAQTDEALQKMFDNLTPEKQKELLDEAETRARRNASQQAVQPQPSQQQTTQEL